LILLGAILSGLTTGLLVARWKKRPWVFPSLRLLWLVILAYLPQFLAFSLPITRTRIPDIWASGGLVVSQLLLLVFCWYNRRIPGIWLMALGTALNLIVIIVNGGLMPISPETAARLVPADVLASYPMGTRFGYGKDILLLPEQTHLAWLSDAFLPPEWFPYQVAFSLGDILIAVGAFWLTSFACLLERIKEPIQG